MLKYAKVVGISCFWPQSVVINYIVFLMFVFSEKSYQLLPFGDTGQDSPTLLIGHH